MFHCFEVGGVHFPQNEKQKSVNILQACKPSQARSPPPLQERGKICAGNALTAASISISSSKRQLFQLMGEALHYHHFNLRLRRGNHAAFELISGAVMKKERREEQRPGRMLNKTSRSSFPELIGCKASSIRAQCDF